MKNQLTEKDKEFLESLKQKLHISLNYNIPFHEESIMGFQKICYHDDGYLCDHRLNWLLTEIEKHLINR